PPRARGPCARRRVLLARRGGRIGGTAMTPPQLQPDGGGRPHEASTEERIAAARAYIDALVSHDASGVPLADEAVRYEMGLRTGRSGAHIARSLERGPQFRVIASVRDVTSWREGDTV